MRVLMLSEYPFCEAEQGMGGVMQATYQLLEGMSCVDFNDLEIHLITTTFSCSQTTVRKYRNITLHFIPKTRFTLAQIALTPLRLYIYALRLAREINPDLVHGQGSVAFIVLSLILGRKSIQTVHGLYANELATIPKTSLSPTTRLKFAVKIMIERWYLRRIRNLIAITSQIVELMNRSGNVSVRVFKINNAIDSEFFDFPKNAENNGLEEKQSINILFVAAITPRKGLHVLVQAFKRLSEQYPNIRLYVVGMWDWAPEYVQEQSNSTAQLQAEGRVLFTGGIEREQLIQHFADADIFVLPSYAESAPMVISQAMCAGLPIVTTDVGGIPEMISQGSTGLMVSAGDVDALEAALSELIESPGLRSELADAALEVGFTRYHPVSIARATVEAYKVVTHD